MGATEEAYRGDHRNKLSRTFFLGSIYNINNRVAARGPLAYRKNAHGAWRYCRAVDERQKHVPASILDQVIDFTKNFVDVCHHGKEEESLFPASGKGRMLREESGSDSKDAP